MGTGALVWTQPLSDFSLHWGIRMNKKTEVDFLNSKSGNVEKFSYREENKQEQKIDQYNPQGIDRQ